MVKLAEPRTKKKYNLVPRGKALYEDDTRFGTKMLEKMGWTKGKGLGAREEGSKDFVHVRYKHDAEGLGYEARDDQWTQHQESFNGLLKSLTENTSGKKADEREDTDVENRRSFGLGFSQSAENNKAASFKAEISGQSLEERSKQSRARVHYKKFTRGKDLAQYSEKDLANIFGKKITDDAVKPADKEIIENIEKSSTLSVSDYFKNKMEALKLKQNVKQPANIYSMEHDRDHDSIDVNGLAATTMEMLKKKKKSKKDKQIKNEEIMLDVDNELKKNEGEHESEYVKVVKNKKKNKKEKHLKHEEEKCNIEDDVEVEEEKVVLNKSKKNKQKDSLDAVPVHIKAEVTKKKEPKMKRKNEDILKNDAKKLRKNSIKEESKDKFTIEDMLEMMKSYQTYTISSTGAELFRFADFNAFEGANISHFSGYDVPKNVKLQVKKSKNDRNQLIRLWYQKKESKLKPTPYEEYTLLARTARENNERQPRLKTYKFAKKNAFKIVNI